MKMVEPPPAAEEQLRSRIIGQAGDGAAAPRLLITAGLHGNEPAGVTAVEHVCASIAAEGIEVRGQFLGLVGNRRALAAERRFLVHDLNRIWLAERTALFDSNGTGNSCPVDLPADPEFSEQCELDSAMRQFADKADRPFHLDLHTTSGSGPPFTVFSHTLRARAFAREIPVPLVLGLHDQIEGTLVDHCSALGYTCAVFEGGADPVPESLENLEAAIWLALEGCGLMAANHYTDDARSMLAERTRSFPSLLEIRHRHDVACREAFQMIGGLSGFQVVRAGQVLAEENGSPVEAHEDGYLLMPLYQLEGNDGFFLMRAVDDGDGSGGDA